MICLSKNISKGLGRNKILKSVPFLLRIVVTRKYPLRGYILGVLTHTTALDQPWGGIETLKCRKVASLRSGLTVLQEL